MFKKFIFNNLKMLKKIIDQCKVVHKQYVCAQNKVLLLMQNQFLLNLDSNCEFRELKNLTTNLDCHKLYEANKTNIDSILNDKKLGYWPIYTDQENSEFSIRALIVPKGQNLPIHDHPDMFVISKIMKG